VADIDAFVQAEADALVAELPAGCAIPSISTGPEHDADVRRSAEHLAGLMEAAGLDTEVLAVDDGQPAADVNIRTFGGSGRASRRWTTPPTGPPPAPSARSRCATARAAPGRSGRCPTRSGPTVSPST
jgi:hypothetical protein